MQLGTDPRRRLILPDLKGPARGFSSVAEAPRETNALASVASSK